MLQRHIENQDRCAPRQGRPVETVRHLTGTVVPGDEGDGGIGFAVGGGNSGIGQAAEAGGNAGNDPEGYLGGDQGPRPLQVVTARPQRRTDRRP